MLNEINFSTGNFWFDRENALISGESALFVRGRNIRPAFPVLEMLTVENVVEKIVYQRGRDWDFADGEIIRLPGSAIPEFRESDMYPDPASAKVFPDKNADAVTGGPDGKLLRFDNKDFFARNQVTFSYHTAVDAIPELPELPDNLLPGFCSRLQRGEPVKITALGDSITEGFNASKFVGIEPYQPCYIELFAAFLEQRFNSIVELHNLAIEGTCIDNAIERQDLWKDNDIDLYVIAYGMNDFVCRTPEQFISLAEKLMDLSPNSEFLFVTSMSANKEWSCISPDKDIEFAAELRQWCCRNEIALADVNTLWHEILSKRDYLSLTGNGVNHPNDFGHRLYASVLSHLFIK